MASDFVRCYPRIRGKVAVVTGSSKGIGASIAERLSKDAASVVANYSRSADFAEAVVQRIKSSGGRAVAVQADVSNPSEITKLFSLTREAFGGLDILVNNAGIYKFVPLAEITVEHIDQHFNLDVKAMLLVSHRHRGVHYSRRKGAARQPAAASGDGAGSTTCGNLQFLPALWKCISHQGSVPVDCQAADHTSHRNLQT